jgi:hypothetical protein
MNSRRRIRIILTEFFSGEHGRSSHSQNTVIHKIQSTSAFNTKRKPFAHILNENRRLIFKNVCRIKSVVSSNLLNTVLF